MSQAPVSVIVESLKLGGGDDELDILEAVEHAFDVRFGEETANWTTVGDLEAALLRLCPASTVAGKCASSMAFHALRSVIRTLPGAPDKIAPGTYLKDLGQSNAKLFHAALRSALPGHVDGAYLSPVGRAGCLVVLAGLFGGAVAGFQSPSVWPLVLLVPAGIGFVFLDRGSFGLRTMGILAKAYALNNRALFVARGADSRPQTIWSDLRVILSECSQVAAERIGRETRFYPLKS